MPTLDPKIFDLYAEADDLAGGTGTSVTSFTDLSGNARHLAATANQPNIESAAVGGKKSVTFTGNNNPLVWNGTMKIVSGWMVVKVNQFTNYNGVLSSPQHIAILEGRNNEPYFFDNLYDYFEYRLNDRIYPNRQMPAPVAKFGLIYFRAWKALTVEGVQIGQDRNLADRKLNGSIALVALSSKGFCEEDVQKYTQALAIEYDIPIAPTFPYSASKVDTGEAGAIILSGGGSQRTKEIKRGLRWSFDTSYSDRSTREYDGAFDFTERYLTQSFLFRDYKSIPPKDTIVEFPDNFKFQDRGNNGIRRNYGLNFVETPVPPIYHIPGQLPPAPKPPEQPIPPFIEAIDDDTPLSTIKFNHDPLGQGELEISVNKARPFVPYSSVANAQGVIEVGNVARPFGYYEVRTRAATGRIRSDSTKSPAFTLAASENLEPVATNPRINGTTTVGQVLTGEINYFDAEGNAPGTHYYEWYRADNATGAGEAQIENASGKNYTLTPADFGKHISVHITPVAKAGTLIGQEVKSNYTTTSVVRFPAPAPTINLTTTKYNAGLAGFNYAAGFSTPQDYEYSVSTGAAGTWATAQSNPIDVGNATYAPDQVQVRTKGNDALGRAPSVAIKYGQFTASTPSGGSLSGYSITNPTPLRTLAPETDDLAELARFVASVITDLSASQTLDGAKYAGEFGTVYDLNADSQVYEAMNFVRTLVDFHINDGEIDQLAVEGITGTKTFNATTAELEDALSAIAQLAADLGANIS